MDPEDADVEDLIVRAEQGDTEARQQLLTGHRQRLRRMVALRLDRRIAARVDPSDVVQETLANAADKLSDYLRERPLPFSPWLRGVHAPRLRGLNHGASRHHGATSGATPGSTGRLGPTGPADGRSCGWSTPTPPEPRSRSLASPTNSPQPHIPAADASARVRPKSILLMTHTRSASEVRKGDKDGSLPLLGCPRGGVARSRVG